MTDTPRLAQQPDREALKHALARFECLAEQFEESGDTASWAMCSVDADRMRKALAPQQITTNLAVLPQGAVEPHRYLDGWMSDQYAAGAKPPVSTPRPALDPVTVEADEDHPDCITKREHELYDALMGLASHAVAYHRDYKQWTQGGVTLEPIVSKALRLGEYSVPSTARVYDPDMPPVCCYCDHDLSCAYCGMEQPPDNGVVRRSVSLQHRASVTAT